MTELGSRSAVVYSVRLRNGWLLVPVRLRLSLGACWVAAGM